MTLQISRSGPDQINPVLPHWHKSLHVNCQTRSRRKGSFLGILQRFHLDRFPECLLVPSPYLAIVEQSPIHSHPVLTTHLVIRGEITLQEQGKEKRTFKEGDRADVGACVKHEAWIGSQVSC
jgi:hypothetical protein